MIHFLQDGVTGGSTVADETNLEAARRLHRELGYGPDHSVGFSDVFKFERHLDVKILIFHHNDAFKKLEMFQTHMGQHPKTIWLYLYDNHYHSIVNRTDFFGTRYVCVNIATRPTMQFYSTNALSIAMCV